jgi:hypothetical protein
MAHNVDDHTIRVSNEESAHSPRLVRKGIYDVGSGGCCRVEESSDILDFNCDLGCYRRGLVFSDHGYLGGGVTWGNECHDPSEIHCKLQSKNLNIKVPTGVEIRRGEVRDDSVDVHRRMPPWR